MGVGILVVYDDNTFDKVNYYRLDFLIKTGRVVKFRRSDGRWVSVADDPVRGDGGVYSGPDRRRKSTVRRVL
ncbi:MAG: hypothetical protein FD174_2013 [Geobacteraceae bacterium]|nr:MAG: hypothetical protein FD174_2013 [Geobacteraceae bacterium]